MSKQCETNYVRIIQRSSQYVNICAVHLTVSVTVAITTVIRPTTHLQVAESDAFMLPLSINSHIFRSLQKICTTTCQALHRNCICALSTDL